MRCAKCGGPVSEEEGFYIKRDGATLCWDCALKEPWEIADRSEDYK